MESIINLDSCVSPTIVGPYANNDFEGERTADDSRSKNFDKFNNSPQTQRSIETDADLRKLLKCVANMSEFDEVKLGSIAVQSLVVGKDHWFEEQTMSNGSSYKFDLVEAFQTKDHRNNIMI